MKIFASFGTSHIPFPRMVHAVNALFDEGHKIICQRGVNDGFRHGITLQQYFTRNRILEELVACDVILTQGGFGSLYDATISEKPTIVLPRISLRNETDHDQIEMCEFFSKSANIHICLDEKLILEYLSNIDLENKEQYSSQIFSSKNESIDSIICRYTEQLHT